MTTKQKDPTFNFTLSQNDARGMPVPEQAIYQLIGWALQQIVQTIGSADNVVDQLFARLNDKVRNQIKDWLVNHQNISITLNWPRDDVGLPFIAVITESEDEASDLDMLGDYAGVHTLGTLDPNTLQQSRQLYKIGLKNVTNIIIAADDPNMVLYLGALLRYIFLQNKLQLLAMYDMHDLMLSQKDLKWDERFLPKFTYMRMVTLTYSTYFDINITTKTSLITSLDLLVSTFETGQEVDTPVYPEEEAPPNE